MYNLYMLVLGIFLRVHAGTRNISKSAQAGKAETQSEGIGSATKRSFQVERSCKNVKLVNLIQHRKSRQLKGGILQYIQYIQYYRYTLI